MPTSATSGGRCRPMLRPIAQSPSSQRRSRKLTSSRSTTGHTLAVASEAAPPAQFGDRMDSRLGWRLGAVCNTATLPRREMASGASEMDTFCRYCAWIVTTRRLWDRFKCRVLGVLLTAPSCGHSAIHRTKNHQSGSTMISPEVMQELLAVRQVLHYLPESQSTEKGWTPHEQQLFWVALTTFPQGPWTAIAEYIGTKTTRQAMTHAQKLRQKLKRWNSRLRSNPAVSSLMDGVTVTEDGNVTVSASALYGIPTISASFPPPPLQLDRGVAVDGRVGSGELETKDSEQHGGGYGCTIVPATPSQVQPPLYDHRAISGVLPPTSPVSFMLGLHAHSQVSAVERTMSSHATMHDEMHTTIPHDFLDELTKALWEEGNGEEEEDDDVTEEELKELDDGELAD